MRGTTDAPPQHQARTVTDSASIAGVHCVTHRFSPTIQGIEFHFPTRAGTVARGLVLAQVLVFRYRCANHPDGWLEAFRLNRGALEEEAARLEAIAPMGGLVILADLREGGQLPET